MAELIIIFPIPRPTIGYPMVRVTRNAVGLLT